MQQERLPVNTRPLWPIVTMSLAALVYLLSLVGVAWSMGFGSILNSIALLGLGGAVSWFTVARLAPRPKQLSLRVQALWRREQILAFGVVAFVYLTLIFGTVAATIGGLWSCTTFPLCAPIESQASLTLLHRGVAATATVLVLGLAIWAMRTHNEQAFRPAAFWAIGLIVAQNIAGLFLVLAADNGEGMSLASARLTHFAIGAFTWSAVVVLATMVVRVPPLKRPLVLDAKTETAVVPPPSLLKDYLSLTKPGVITLLIFTTLVAMFITPAGMPSLSLIFWTMLGGWLMPAGAQSINCYFDRDIDVKMGRTSRRPIPSGRIPAWHALALGLFLGAVAFAILAIFVNVLTAWVALAGYVYYAVIYTMILKRHSVHNIVIGGGAGAIPPLVGWAAVTGSLSWSSLLLFAIIFYWTPPHFWALALIRRKDYANAGVPMLPVVSGDEETKRQILIYTLIMVGLSLLMTPFQLMGWAYFVIAALLGLVFIRYVLNMMRDDTTARRWALYRFSLLYLFLLFVAMLVDRLVFG
jgi:protoheme IX farnesyltransferase